MPTSPTILKSTTGVKQDPEALNRLSEQKVMAGLKAVWSKEGLVINDPNVCMVDMICNILDYARKENCGKCIPCREGTRQMHHILSMIRVGGAKPHDLVNLRDLAMTAAEASDCSFGEIVGLAPIPSQGAGRAKLPLSRVRTRSWLGKSLALPIREWALGVLHDFLHRLDARGRQRTAF